MRMRRLSLPVLVLTLGLAAPAAAGEQAVDVIDYDFMPKALQIQPGDTVTWTFSGDAEHTTTSSSGQAERWDSGIVAKGTSFSHTFAKPGRFSYVCLPHRSFMKGTVQVGEDTVPATVEVVKTTVRRKRATTRFELLEPATVSGKVTGPKKKKLFAALRRTEPGRAKVAWSKKKLPPGVYKGALTFTDDFQKKSTKKVSFRIPK